MRAIDGLADGRRTDTKWWQVRRRLARDRFGWRRLGANGPRVAAEAAGGICAGGICGGGLCGGGLRGGGGGEVARRSYCLFDLISTSSSGEAQQRLLIRDEALLRCERLLECGRVCGHWFGLLLLLAHPARGRRGKRHGSSRGGLSICR